MSLLYSIFFAIAVGTSLFAMDKKDDDSDATDPKNPVSCHMEPKFWTSYESKKTGKSYTTYKYHDGSKSTYYSYKDSSD